MEVLVEEIEVSKPTRKKTGTGLAKFGNTRAETTKKAPSSKRATVTPKPKPKPKTKPEDVPAPTMIEPKRRGPAKTYEEPRRGVTLRFTDEQHDAIRQFAFDERTTVQQIALDGIALVFERRGLRKPW